MIALWDYTALEGQTKGKLTQPRRNSSLQWLYCQQLLMRPP